MPTVEIEPTKDHPLPFDTDPDTTTTFVDELTVAANTAELQVELGAPLEVDEGTAQKEMNLIDKAIKEKKTTGMTTNTAFAAAAFLRTYGQQVALDVAQTRAAITHKLMEIANCGDARYELKALELLGKHSDIGLFTERSEITINYKNPEDLENAIKERVKRLLNAEVIDVTPVGLDLDEQLGVVDFNSHPLMDELNETNETESDETTDDDDSQAST